MEITFCDGNDINISFEDRHYVVTASELSRALNNLIEEQKQEKEQKRIENRFQRDNTYYYMDIYGEVKQDFDKGQEVDDRLFENANYCTDEAFMEQRALHETLNRLLWRYSEEHGGDNKPWDGYTPHYFLYFSGLNKIITGYNTLYKPIGVIYFNDEGTANSAIQDVVKPFMEKHPEFKW